MFIKTVHLFEQVIARVLETETTTAVVGAMKIHHIIAPPHVSSASEMFTEFSEKGDQVGEF